MPAEETRVLTIKAFIALRPMIINALGVDLELTRALLLTQKAIDLCELQNSKDEGFGESQFNSKK